MTDPVGAPPRFATRIVARALRGDPARSAILGDLLEDHARVARERGPAAAHRWYVREALGLAADRILHDTLGTLSGNRSMSDSSASRGLLQDAGYAFRALRRNPAFTLFTAAVIGLGVGAATAVYSVLEPLVLAPLPFDEPDRLVWITNDAPIDEASLSSITSRSSNLRDFRARARSFDGITGYNAFFEQEAYTLTGAGEPERLAGAGVAHDFLDVLGVEPLLGRSFSEEEGAWGGPPAMILSHGFWERRFAGDRGVVGRALTIDGEPRSVVGVLPPDFDFASIFTPGVQVDFLVPFPVSDETDRWGNTMLFVGRLRPGVGPDAAEAELQAIVAALEEAQPDRWGLAARVAPIEGRIAGPFRHALGLLVAAAATLLVIVCVNVTNLLLARAPGRAREVAIRRALGASRGRLVRQLLLETLGMALAGSVLGGALAWAATRAVAGGAAVRIPRLGEVGADASTLAFAAGVAVLTGLLVGLVPALQVAEGGEASVLRAGGRGASSSRSARRLREGLVVAEVTLACVLLVVGGLLVRSFQAVLRVDLGFDPADAVAWQLDPSTPFSTNREKSDFFLRAVDRVREVPGVEAAGLVDALPLGRNRTWGFRVVGAPEEDDERYSVFPHIVDPGYRAAMRIPLLAGRDLTRDDTGDSAPVVLVNASGARLAFGGVEEAVGRRIGTWGEAEWEVVGVVADVRHVTPESGAGTQVYFPMTQMVDYGTMDLVVRSSSPPARVVEAVGAALRELDSSMPIREFWTLDATVERAVSARRFTLAILGAYGAAALLLAGLGIYGVLAQSVSERRAEIGIRMALGASAPLVVRSVLGRTLVLAGVGVAVGALIAFWSARLLDSLLYGVGATDPTTFLTTVAVLLAVAGAAGLIPAARAARTRGVRALRAE